jgi:hypothetical protein
MIANLSHADRYSVTPRVSVIAIDKHGYKYRVLEQFNISNMCGLFKPCLLYVRLTGEYNPDSPSMVSALSITNPRS